MQININWDSSVNSLSGSALTSFESAINAAVQILDQAIQNNITVNINVGYGEVNGSSLAANVSAAGPASYLTTTYANLRSALVAASPGDAADLPASDPAPGLTVAVPIAEAMVLGYSQTPGTVDGYAGFGSGFTGTVLEDAALHELTHALGRVTFYNIGFTGSTYATPLEYLRYSAPGTRAFTAGQTGSQFAPAYFSLDGGSTNIASYDTASDVSDWTGTSDPFNWQISSGIGSALSQADLSLLRALGYSTGTVTVIDYPAGSNRSSTIVLTGNGTQLQVTTGTATQSGVISESGGSQGLEKTGGGKLILTADETYTGVTTITGGTLQLGNGGGLSGSLSGNIVDNAALTFNYGTSAPVNYAGSITGTGSLTVDGGVVSLTGDNNFSGGTTVISGALWIGGAGGFGASTTTGSLTGNISLPTLEFPAGTGSAYLGFGRSDHYIFSGNISGVGHVEAIGSGTLTLTGDNSAHTGYLVLEDGVLQVASDANLGGGLIRMGTGTLRFLASYTSTLSYALRGAAFDTNGHDIVLAGPLTTDDSANTPIYGGILKTGAGTLTLAGANTYTGITTISGGTLVVSSDANLGASSGGLQLSGGSDPTQAGTLRFGASFNLASARAITLGQGVATIDTNGFNTTISQGIKNGTGGLVKAGAGTLVLGGQSTYAGGTTLNAGTLRLGPGGSLASTGAVTVNSGTFDVNGQAASIGKLSGTGGTITLGSGSLSTSFVGTSTLATPISGSGSLTTNASGTLILTGANSYTGGTTLNGGTLQIGNGGTTGSITGSVGGFGTLSFNRSDSLTFGGAISGNMIVSQDGLGTTTLTGANTYAFGTVVNAGTLRLGTGGTLGSGAELTVNGGTLDLNNIDLMVGAAVGLGGSITLGSANLTVTGNVGSPLASVISGAGSVTVSAGLLRLTGANTYTGGTIITGTGGLDIGYGGTTGSVAGDITNNSVLGFNHSNTFVYGGAVSGSGRLLNLGLGTLILTGTNTYTGSTETGSGLIQIGNGGTTGSISGDVLAGSLGIAFNRSNSLTYNGVISGSGRVWQTGSGTTILGGANTYTGVTTVSGGTLLVDGAIASSAVTVASGASLGGPGTVGATSIQSGGTLAPGDGIGTLHVNGNLNLASGATYAEDMSPTAGDEIIVAGNASIAGNLAANLSGGSYGHQTYTILHSAGTLSGTFANFSLTGLPAGLIAGLTYGAHDVTLTTDHAPAAVTANKTAAQGQSFALSSLVSLSDPDGDAITGYQLWDTTSDPNSGHFVVNGVVQAARTVIDVTAAQLTQTSFVAGSVGDSLQIRAFDGYAWSAADNASWAPFTVTPPPNNPPVVTTSNKTMAVGTSVALSTLFSVTDADGDSMTRYQIWDGTHDANAGYIQINGQAQPAGLIEMTAGQMAQASFVMGSLPTGLQIRAFDGIAWSAADNASWAPFTVSPPPDTAPVVATSNKTMAAASTVALSTLFNVSDADGDSMTRYQIWDGSRDPNAGYLTISGVPQPAGLIDITAAQLTQTSFVAGTAATGLQIRAFDGQKWSAADNASWAPFTVSPPPDTAPVVTTSNKTMAVGATAALSSLFNVSDADGDAMTKYQIWEGITDPNAGYIVVGSARQPAGLIEVTAAQMAQASFMMGSLPTGLQIRAFDGQKWSAPDDATWAPFTVSPQPNTPPVVTTSNKTMPAGATVALSGLFSVGDADGDTITKYQLWESTRDLSAGYVTINGNRQPAAALIEMTAAQMAQASFVVGTVATNLQIRAFDGKDWSAADSASWAPFNVSPGTDHAPVLTTTDKSATAGQSFALSSLFNLTDADGDTMTKYQLWDGTAAAASGHFVINGQAQSAGTLIEISAAQLSQTAFVAGQSGASDLLQIRAFDGFAWSAADNAAWAPFHINV